MLSRKVKPYKKVHSDALSALKKIKLTYNKPKDVKNAKG